MIRGAFIERVRNAWVEMRENLGRSTLQSLGIMLGVASVLGGFSISDSMRQRSKELFRKMGGMDKLSIQPSATVRDGSPTALQMANLGLRNLDAETGQGIDTTSVDGVSIQKFARARVRSAYADQERDIRGIGRDFLALDGYQVARGRGMTSEDLNRAAPVAVLGSEAAGVFFPSGDAVGKMIRISDTPVEVIGILKERVFYFRKSNRNMFRWRNRIIGVPTSLVTQRFQGDRYQRLDRLTFRIRQFDVMESFSTKLSTLLKSNHRLQNDFRIDNVAARIRRERSQGDVYDVIFLLSGVLSLIGGGMVNVNIQLASLKERIREVGVKMAIGASGREIFKDFMTEAMLLTMLGSFVGLGAGVGFAWGITHFLGIPLHMDLKSFAWAWFMAGAFGLVFALFPAWKASRLSPMEALHYE